MQNLNIMKRLLLVGGIILTLCQSYAGQAPSSSASPNTFITLGTSAGPEGNPRRAQPANALVVGSDVYLVDAGDGAASQLVKAGYRIPSVKGLFISHNHFDHTGGVLAVFGLRMQLNAKNTLMVYGPPGTKTFVDGLLAGMEPARLAGYGMPGQSWQANIKVQEVVQGASIKLPGMTVTVAENSHFKVPQGSGASEKAKSLSFRFDLDDRSIVYTGDTGPSPAVAKLAKNADLLISEMMDIPAVMGFIRKTNPNMPKPALEGIEWHLKAHHLLPAQVGELAKEAAVKKLVVTHMSPDVRNEAMAERYRGEIAKAFKGEIVIADDFDRF